MYHAYRDAGGWHTQRVGYGGSHQSLALSQDGRAHISYNSGTGDNDLKYAFQDEETHAWNSLTVESDGATGLATALALDADGFPHIRYYKDISQGDDYIDGELRYAFQDPDGWHVEVVDHEGDAGEYASLAVDAQGWAQVSYFDSTHGDLKYALQSASGWITSTVDSAGTVGQWTSLAIDGADYPHISYYDETRSDLRYAYHDASGWYTQTIDIGDVSPGTALALDGAGYGRISYAKAGYLYYAVQDAAGWITGTTGIAPSGSPIHGVGCGWLHSRRPLRLRVLLPGRIRLAQRVAVDGGKSACATWRWNFIRLPAHQLLRPPACDRDLKYAYKNVGGWHDLTLDTAGDVGLYTSIALDASNGVHISYYDISNRELEYMSRASGAWFMQTVDDFGDVGRYCFPRSRSVWHTRASPSTMIAITGSSLPAWSPSKASATCPCSAVDPYMSVFRVQTGTPARTLRTDNNPFVHY